LRCRRRTEVAALALLTLAVEACAVNVAQVRREWGSELVRSDPDRGVLVNLFPPEGTPDSVVIGLPIRPGDLTGDPGTRLFGPCMRAWWLTQEQRVEILELSESALRATLATRVGLANVATPTLDPDSAPQRPSLVVSRPTTAPDLVNELGELGGSLLLEADIVSSPSVACFTRTTSRLFLIDLGSVRPAGGTAMGFGAAVLGAIVLTGLITMVAS